MPRHNRPATSIDRCAAVFLVFFPLSKKFANFRVLASKPASTCQLQWRGCIGPQRVHASRASNEGKPPRSQRYIISPSRNGPPKCKLPSPVFFLFFAAASLFCVLPYSFSFFFFSSIRWDLVNRLRFFSPPRNAVPAANVSESSHASRFWGWCPKRSRLSARPSSAGK